MCRKENPALSIMNWKWIKLFHKLFQQARQADISHPQCCRSRLNQWSPRWIHGWLWLSGGLGLSVAFWAQRCLGKTHARAHMRTAHRCTNWLSTALRIVTKWKGCSVNQCRQQWKKVGTVLPTVSRRLIKGSGGDYRWSAIPSGHPSCLHHRICPYSWKKTRYMRLLQWQSIFCINKSLQLVNKAVEERSETDCSNSWTLVVLPFFLEINV